MAKKFRKTSSAAAHSPAPHAQSTNTSRSDIKHDLLQTVIVNALFIALLVGLHQWNSQNGDPLTSWISNLI